MKTSPETEVYIIDDDHDVLSTLTLLIETVGLKSEPFSSAEEFLESSRPSPGSCVLTDIRLSGMSGIELAKKLKGDGLDIPIILISGHMDFEASNAHDFGELTEFLEKPVDSRKLIARIENAINRSLDS